MCIFHCQWGSIMTQLIHSTVSRYFLSVVQNTDSANTYPHPFNSTAMCTFLFLFVSLEPFDGDFFFFPELFIQTITNVCWLWSKHCKCTPLFAYNMNVSYYATWGKTSFDRHRYFPKISDWLLWKVAFAMTGSHIALIFITQTFKALCLLSYF